MALRLCSDCIHYSKDTTESPCGGGCFGTEEKRNWCPGKMEIVSQEEIHRNAVEHGWWEDTRPIPELLCLIHSEVSEALEAYRKGDTQEFKEELADIYIRLADMCEGLGVNLPAEVQKKHNYNKTRPYRHGNKRC